MLDHILLWYEDLLILRAGAAESMVTNLDYLDMLKSQAERYSLEHLREGIRSIMNTRRYLEGNITPQLAIENMLFDLRPY